MARPIRSPSGNGERGLQLPEVTIPQDVINPSSLAGGISDRPLRRYVALTTFMGWLNTCAVLAPADHHKHAPVGIQHELSGPELGPGHVRLHIGQYPARPNPNYPNCRTCTWNGDWDCPGMYGLSSFHPGGGNIAMADGSVRFLKSSTAMNIVWGLGSRNGGEVISSDQY